MFFKRLNSNFWVQYKTFHLQWFWLSHQKICNFCCYNALNSNPSRTSDKKDWQKRAVAKIQWKRFWHLFFVKSVMSVRPIMGVYSKDKKLRKFRTFPESRTQTAGEKSILIEPKKLLFSLLKNIFSYTTVICEVILFKYFDKFDGQGKVKHTIQTVNKQQASKLPSTLPYGAWPSSWGEALILRWGPQNVHHY